MEDGLDKPAKMMKVGLDKPNGSILDGKGKKMARQPLWKFGEDWG